MILGLAYVNYDSVATKKITGIL